ncbi:ABC transporter substrate-binding protein [Emcibacter sp.]|uniref:ABC transporter substrate-binding protein n=1 Tax=Emcibacter sp. TaxID=1979954 RepID=UPI003A8D3060
MKCAALKFVLFFGAALLLPFSAQADEAQKPRAVSLDYCSDQYVLALADREQVIALSRDATDVHSFYRDLAEGLPQFGSTLEEILAYQPDVIARYWAGSGYVNYLQDQGYKIASAGYGYQRDVLLNNIRIIGHALGQEKRAEEKIKQLAGRFDKLEHLPRKPQLVLYLTPSGITAGKGTYVNDLLNLAGFRTMADEFDYSGWQQTPLEHLVSRKPDLIIASFFDMESNHNSSWSISRHGMVERMLKDIPTIYVPGKYLSCNGIFLPDAAEYILAELAKLENAEGQVAGASE